jgi:hypothetical protein
MTSTDSQDYSGYKECGHPEYRSTADGPQANDCGCTTKSFGDEEDGGTALAQIKQDRVHVVADAWLTPATAAEFALHVAQLANQLSADLAGDAEVLAVLSDDGRDHLSAVQRALADDVAPDYFIVDGAGDVLSVNHLTLDQANQWIADSGRDDLSVALCCSPPIPRRDVPDVSTALAAHTAATLDAIGEIR